MFGCSCAHVALGQLAPVVLMHCALQAYNKFLELSGQGLVSEANAELASLAMHKEPVCHLQQCIHFSLYLRRTISFAVPSVGLPCDGCISNVLV